MEIKEFDCVKLKDGRTGAVVEVFDGGKAFMIEICDIQGKTKSMPIVPKGKIIAVTYSAK